MMIKIPKLLAPVRDEISFSAALAAGADAVYFGVGELNMRVSSKGIDMSVLPDIVKRAHEKNVEIHITLNVIAYENEIERIDEMVRDLKKADVDAVICWDFAVIEACKKYGMPFNISTQASISNSVAARFYETQGARCIVLARECTLEQIADIKKKTNCLIEVFCHGAMCVSVSGRCFMSQFLQGKSANRGECLQPCRREYKIVDEETGGELVVGCGYVMSPKDLCTLSFLDRIVETGADVLKIEGRGRSPEYASIVTHSYRIALDAIRDGVYTDELKKSLINDVTRVYNRGFSTGFLFGTPGVEGWTEPHNQATEKKERVGIVSNYFKKSDIAEVTVREGSIMIGDELYVQGPTTGIERIFVSGVEYHEESKITFPCDRVLRINDEVYKIVKI